MWSMWIEYINTTYPEENEDSEITSVTVRDSQEAVNYRAPMTNKFKPGKRPNKQEVASKNECASCRSDPLTNLMGSLFENKG